MADANNKPNHESLKSNNKKGSKNKQSVKKSNGGKKENLFLDPNVFCCVCKEGFDDVSACISCDMCTKDMHSTCFDSDMPTDVLDYILDAKDKDLSGLYLHCSVCASAFEKICKFDERLRKIKLNMEERLDKLEKLSASQNQPILQSPSSETVSSAPVSMSPAVHSVSVTSSSSTPSLQECIQEAIEKEKCKSNVVIFGLLESSTTADKTTLLNLWKDIGLDLPASVSCERLGKPSISARPLKVRLPDENNKRSVLKAAPMLKNLSQTWNSLHFD